MQHRFRWTIATLCALGVAATGVGSAAAANERAASVPTAAILKLLPKDAKLIASNQQGALILPVDMRGDGTSEYASLYESPNNLVGAVIFEKWKGKLQKLWQYHGPAGLVLPASLSVRDVLHDSKQQVLFQATIGAMANQVELLGWKRRGVYPMFQAQAARVDIGQYNGRGADEIVAWAHDTGNLYNIDPYGWNPRLQRYRMTPGIAPRYFRSVVIPFYQHESHTAKGRQTPKMTAYGLASAYYNAGDYAEALAQANKALRFGPNAYPPDNRVQALKHSIDTKLHHAR